MLPYYDLRLCTDWYIYNSRGKILKGNAGIVIFGFYPGNYSKTAILSIYLCLRF